ncbi:PLDc N-terminal domain-containing protein [Halopiger aswanensis]|uniref:Phospholipase D-like protein n=1 Tax=Halopiger aswanensis TaxID=148449 RepID=A0A3R7DF65_9EURY|nr:PLDc N-terminal domain-containing protein [Halopiger aswanensis]RKD97675.1 phospholipase D-like protein [Halopiger aswanensis]
MGPVAILGLTVVFVSVYVLLSALVLKDAETRGIENSVLWAVIVVVFPVIGLGAYLIRRRMPESDSEDSGVGGTTFPRPGAERSNDSARADESETRR